MQSTLDYWKSRGFLDYREIATGSMIYDAKWDGNFVYISNAKIPCNGDGWQKLRKVRSFKEIPNLKVWHFDDCDDPRCQDAVSLLDNWIRTSNNPKPVIKKR